MEGGIRLMGERRLEITIISSSRVSYECLIFDISNWICN